MSSQQVCERLLLFNPPTSGGFTGRLSRLEPIRAADLGTEFFFFFFFCYLIEMKKISA